MWSIYAWFLELNFNRLSYLGLIYLGKVLLNMFEVDYAYYTDTYKGTSLTEQEFNIYITNATGRVYARTFASIDRLDQTSELLNKVKDTICVVADTVKAYTNNDGVEHGAVTSESVGGTWSMSYAVKDGSSDLDSIVGDKIYISLYNTGLLYGGV